MEIFKKKIDLKNTIRIAKMQVILS